MLTTVILEYMLAWLTRHLDVSMAIIAGNRSFSVSAPRLSPAYALYIKSCAAAKWGMISVTLSTFGYFSFNRRNQAFRLQTANGKTPGQGYLTRIPFDDRPIIALPVSFIVTFAIDAYRAMNKHDLDESHIDRCFKGM